jgi:hypothetical protein
MTPEMLGLGSSTISRAVELSHDKIRPINILDLPIDILHTIFDYFQDGNILVQKKLDGESIGDMADPETKTPTAAKPSRVHASYVVSLTNLHRRPYAQFFK